MRRIGEWFDAQFIQFTAFFLRSDIVVVTSTANLTFCGDPTKDCTVGSEKCNCNFKLYLASWNNTHFRSILPISPNCSNRKLSMKKNILDMEDHNVLPSKRLNIRDEDEDIHSRKRNSDVSKHVCTTCDRAFTERTHLRRHIKIHTNSKSHQCKVCNETFYRLENLQRKQQNA